MRSRETAARIHGDSSETIRVAIFGAGARWFAQRSVHHGRRIAADPRKDHEARRALHGLFSLDANDDAGTPPPARPLDSFRYARRRK